MLSILLVDEAHPLLTAFLTRAGCHYDLLTELDHEGFLSLEDRYDGLVIRSRFVVDAPAIDSKRKLKFIIRLGSGMENIAVEYAESQGISCHSTPEGNAPSVGEYCLGALLSLAKHIPSANAEVKNGCWSRKKNQGRDLGGLTVGIIGYGHTGKAFARKMAGLVKKVYAYDRYQPVDDGEYAEGCALETLLSRCDVLSLHVNYTEENHHFFNQEIINRAGKPFLFINTSRGLAVSTEDLLAALQSGQVAAACLDVLEYETPRFQIPPASGWPATLRELASLEQVVLTPHIAGQTADSEQRHAELAVEIITRKMGKPFPGG